MNPSLKFDFFVGVGMFSTLVWYLAWMEWKTTGFWIGMILFIIIATVALYSF